jgi:hypothetical protein
MSRSITRIRGKLNIFAFVAIFCFFCCVCSVRFVAVAQTASPVPLDLDWTKTISVNRTSITLQVVSNPLLRPGSPIHDNAWRSLAELHPSLARLAFWYPYPHLGVAELSPPAAGQTHWDFSAMDPLVDDFFHSIDRRPSVLAIATIPQWMFSAAAVDVPSDADAAVWNYEQGSILRDSTLREISAYYERVARWYLKGGFRDELGFRHSSGHHFKPSYWEVLNEPEYERNLTARQYTELYDAITLRLHRVDRKLKFTGLSLAIPEHGEDFFTYFLDHTHHASGVRLDAISYHFYAHQKKGDSIGADALSFFNQADQFLESVNKVEAIRRRLSPSTETQINETGCIGLSDDVDGPDKMSGVDIPPYYWNLCGALFSYVAARLSEQGIQTVGASQLLGYPSQYPTVSLLDWTTGLPNARYYSLKLLIDDLPSGDRLGAPRNSPVLYALPFVGKNGSRSALIINKTADELRLTLPDDPAKWMEQHVDLTSTLAPSSRDVVSKQIELGPFAVMLLTCSK